MEVPEEDAKREREHSTSGISNKITNTSTTNTPRVTTPNTPTTPCHIAEAETSQLNVSAPITILNKSSDIISGVEEKLEVHDCYVERNNRRQK